MPKLIGLRFLMDLSWDKIFQDEKYLEEYVVGVVYQ